MTILQDQPQVTSELANSIAQQRVVHAYLFAGSNQEQLERLGLWFVQGLFCLHKEDGYPCLECNNCRRIAHNDFPDVVTLSTTKRSIGVDEIRSFKSEMEQTSVEGLGRVLLIKQADKLTTSAANSLLKFLEEPVGKVVTILLSKNSESVLPTIKSRVQLIQLKLGEDSDLRASLLERGYHEADILTIQQAHLDNEVLMDLEVSKFQELKKLAQQWTQQLFQDAWAAFIQVGTNLVPAVDNRGQQQLLLNLLEWNFSQQLVQAASDSAQLASTQQLTIDFLHAKTMWQANVSFQNSLEQLAIKATSLIKRG